MKDNPNHFKFLEMCENVVRKRSYLLRYVVEHLKTKEMCEKVVEEDPCELELVSDWFVTQEQIGLWHDSKYWDDAKIIKWYEGHQKRKAQKPKIN